jgi:hypothetical protein
MSQSQLDSAVARATGENLETIQRRGFSPVRLPRRINRCLHPPRGGVRTARPSPPPDRAKERE